jgi:hypothetical protein
VRFLSRAGRGNGKEGFDGLLTLELKMLGSDQLQPFGARVTNLADDVVVMQSYAKQLYHFDDHLRHLDVGA